MGLNPSYAPPPTDGPLIWIREALIRYNPPEDGALFGVPMDKRIHPEHVLTMLGWDPSRLRIETCHFMQDDDLEPGRAVFYPL